MSKRYTTTKAEKHHINMGKSSEKSKAKTAAKPATPNAKKKIVPPVSSSESESESERSESESGSGSEEESGSEESESGSESESSGSGEENELLRKVAPVPPPAVQRAAAVFKLPANYNEVEMDRNDNPFSASRLKGKQIWLFTTPASVPLAEVKKFKMEQLRGRKPVAEVKGKRFCFREENVEEEAGTYILLPTDRGKGQYSITSIAPTKFIRLEEYVELPKLPSEDQLKDKREFPKWSQPKGLKMRYKPFGSDANLLGGLSDSEEDRDVDMVDAGASSTLVNGEARRKEKRRMSETGVESRKKVRFDADVREREPKERKKHKNKDKKRHKEKTAA